MNIDFGLLFNYGILGLWTASLMLDKRGFQNKIEIAINKLTEAIKEKL